ncbi:hypothetical protein ARMSODRAFT_203552 [Armillaria solidipes]|uniref:Uncharacterized protein n=1 Tax=Armillaria solidipes TaxID=1076256 RepID=A0A2H3BX19_9AGAR|nr:hypothetical protein ARMSODRAFT_203552 [Armillaria solidipes]
MHGPVEISGTTFKLTCTSAQHFTSRGARRGRGKESIFRWRSGDTRYRSVRTEDEAESLVSPACKEIGTVFTV